MNRDDKLRRAEALIEMLDELDAAIVARNQAVQAAESTPPDATADDLQRIARTLAAAAQRCLALGALVDAQRQALGIGLSGDGEATHAAQQTTVAVATQLLDRAALR